MHNDLIQDEAAPIQRGVLGLSLAKLALGLAIWVAAYPRSRCRAGVKVAYVTYGNGGALKVSGIGLS